MLLAPAVRIVVRVSQITLRPRCSTACFQPSGSATSISMAPARIALAPGLRSFAATDDRGLASITRADEPVAPRVHPSAQTFEARRYFAYILYLSCVAIGHAAMKSHVAAAPVRHTRRRQAKIWGIGLLVTRRKICCDYLSFALAVRAVRHGI